MSGDRWLDKKSMVQARLGKSRLKVVCMKYNAIISKNTRINSALHTQNCKLTFVQCYICTSSDSCILACLVNCNFSLKLDIILGARYLR